MVAKMNKNAKSRSSGSEGGKIELVRRNRNAAASRARDTINSTAGPGNRGESKRGGGREVRVSTPSGSICVLNTTPIFLRKIAGKKKGHVLVSGGQGRKKC